MDDLISRAAARDVINTWGRHESEEVRMDLLYNDMNAIPAVDAAPVVHGRWIDETPEDYLDPRMRCSICKEIETPLIKWRYCPNCGAKMDGGEEDG